MMIVYLQISLHEKLSKQYIIGEEMIPGISILHPVYRLLILKNWLQFTNLHTL